jgi:hypothetical protein
MGIFADYLEVRAESDCIDALAGWMVENNVNPIQFAKYVAEIADQSASEGQLITELMAGLGGAGQALGQEVESGVDWARNKFNWQTAKNLGGKVWQGMKNIGGRVMAGYRKSQNLDKIAKAKRQLLQVRDTLRNVNVDLPLDRVIQDLDGMTARIQAGEDLTPYQPQDQDVHAFPFDPNNPVRKTRARKPRVATV